MHAEIAILIEKNWFIFSFGRKPDFEIKILDFVLLQNFLVIL